MYYLIFICNNIILQQEGNKYSVPQAEEPPIAVQPWTTLQELPDFNGEKCTAYSITTPPKDGLPLGMVTMDLRASFHVLSKDMYLLAGKAQELLYWDSNTKFCGVCGAPMKRYTAISKRCTNCGKEIWPQVAPAIIVRIIRPAVVGDGGDIIEPEKILLVHARNFRRKDYFGLVAGFVETGETLEECVVREVQEETQLTIGNIKYFGSQPWPYPCGIMIGFTAEYVSGEISLQDEELSNGGWFSKDNIPNIPDKMSIARKLIDDWLEK